MDFKVLAEVILDAQNRRMASFDHGAEARATKKLDGKNLSFVNQENYYGLTLYEAADEAVAKAGLDLRALQLVFILLSNSCGDAQLWAKTVFKDAIDKAVY